MNKIIIFSLFLILLSSSFVSALDLLINNYYNPGSTLIAELKGNVMSPIEHSDVNFYYGRKIVSMDYDIAKLGDSYFLYAVLPLDERNYSVVINNVHHYDQGREKYSNVTANFSTMNFSVADFSVSPGFVTSTGSFVINVKNLGGDLLLNYGFSNQQLSTTIPYGRVKELQFSTNSFSSSGLYYLSLSSANTSYIVPVYVITANGSSPSQANVSGASFKIGPKDINLQVVRGVVKNINLTIENLLPTPIDTITLSYSQDLSEILKFDSLLITNLSGFAVRNVPVTIVASRNDDFEGLITAFTQNFSDSSKLFISVVNKLNSSATPLDNSSTGSLSSCVATGGILCYSDEVCSGNYTNSVEGLCCLSQCLPRSSIGGSGGGFGSTTLIIVGVLVLLVIGYFFFKKYKDSKGANPNKGLNDLTKKFDNNYKN